MDSPSPEPLLPLVVKNGWKAALSRKLARKLSDGQRNMSADMFEQKARVAEEQALLIRKAILAGSAAQGDGHGTDKPGE